MTASPLIAFAVCFAGQAGGTAAEGPLWIHADRVVVKPGLELLDAAILVERGKIVRVASGLEKPEGARELRAAVACAGFVDPWSTLGLDQAGVDDLSSTPSTRTTDGLDPWWIPEERDEALRAGVTTARVQIGRSAPVGGFGAVIRVDPSPRFGVLLSDACLAATAAIQRAGREPDPFDRIEEVDRLAGLIERGRKYREDAVEYRFDLEEWDKATAEKREELEENFKKAKKSREKAQAEAKEKAKEFKEEKYKEDKKPRRPKFDPDSEALARAAEGEVPLVIEVHRLPELRGLLEVTEPFDRLRLVIAGATEAAEVADLLAERSIPVIVWPAPLGDEARGAWSEHSLELAGELERAGVEVLIGSGGGPHARDLRWIAALAVSHGLDRDAALRAITLGPALAFDVGDRIGSLESGKDADILLFDGDPLETNSRLLQVVAQGRVVE